MTTPIIGHTYTVPGTYEVKLTVTDDDGLVDVLTRWVSVPNLPPVALFDGVVVGTRADLDGSASYDPDGAVMAYSWDFGDGSPVDTAGPSPSHDYALPGPYIAWLTVTDNDGLIGTVGHEVSLGGNDWDDVGPAVGTPLTWATVGAGITWATVTPADIQSTGSVSTVPVVTR